MEEVQEIKPEPLGFYDPHHLFDIEPTMNLTAMSNVSSVSNCSVSLLSSTWAGFTNRATNLLHKIESIFSKAGVFSFVSITSTSHCPQKGILSYNLHYVYSISSIYQKQECELLQGNMSQLFCV